MTSKKKAEKAEESNLPVSWMKMKPAELETLVVELAKEGKGPAQIGLVLRDKHGIPKSKLFGKKISSILKEKNVECKSEKEIVSEKITMLKEHISRNKRDYPAARSLTKRLWALHWIEEKAN